MSMGTWLVRHRQVELRTLLDALPCAWLARGAVDDHGLPGRRLALASHHGHGRAPGGNGTCAERAFVCRSGGRLRRTCGACSPLHAHSLALLVTVLLPPPVAPDLAVDTAVAWRRRRVGAAAREIGAITATTISSTSAAVRLIVALRDDFISLRCVCVVQAQRRRISLHGADRAGEAPVSRPNTAFAKQELRRTPQAWRHRGG